MAGEYPFTDGETGEQSAPQMKYYEVTFQDRNRPGQRVTKYVSIMSNPGDLGRLLSKVTVGAVSLDAHQNYGGNTAGYSDVSARELDDTQLSWEFLNDRNDQGQTRTVRDYCEANFIDWEAIINKK